MNNIPDLDQLAKSSIDLARAANDLGALKVAFGYSMASSMLMLVLFIILVGVLP